jgi:hypothetical protein
MRKTRVEEFTQPSITFVVATARNVAHALMLEEVKIIRTARLMRPSCFRKRGVIFISIGHRYFTVWSVSGVATRMLVIANEFPSPLLILSNTPFLAS